MTTRLDIFNDTLEWLGEPPTSDPDDSATWVTRVRESFGREAPKMFELHTWNFAMTKAQLSAVSPTPDGWSYGFTKPAQCRRIVKVAATANPRAPSLDYVDFGGRILTNSSSTWLDYVDGTKIENLGMWPASVAGALAARIAFKVCPIAGEGAEMRDRLERTARRQMMEAKLLDAQQNGAWTIPPGSYETARGGRIRGVNG